MPRPRLLDKLTGLFTTRSITRAGVPSCWRQTGHRQSAAPRRRGAWGRCGREDADDVSAPADLLVESFLGPILTFLKCDSPLGNYPPPLPLAALPRIAASHLGAAHSAGSLGELGACYGLQW